MVKRLVLLLTPFSAHAESELRTGLLYSCVLVDAETRWRSGLKLVIILRARGSGGNVDDPRFVCYSYMLEPHGRTLSIFTTNK